MKKFLCMILCVVFCAGMLTGCGETKLESDADIVYVDKKGAVTSIDVGELDQSYYSEDELKAFVGTEVDAYTAENGADTVSLDSLTVEDQVAKLTLKYKTVEDYAAFNGIELYQGKVVKALASGYDFNVDFAKVENSAVTGSASTRDIYAEDDLKVVIIRANIDVKVAGEICYVSSQNVEVTGTDTVSIREEGAPEDSFETEVYTYIIYR